MRGVENIVRMRCAGRKPSVVYVEMLPMQQWTRQLTDKAGRFVDIHLGARDPATGGFVMLGKTFKGMTDAMLAWQTQRFEELKTADDGWVVQVRPEQVVEIAFDGLQRSPRYPGGVALRFARVVRYRDDKSAADADTIHTVRELARWD